RGAVAHLPPDPEPKGNARILRAGFGGEGAPVISARLYIRFGMFRQIDPSPVGTTFVRVTQLTEMTGRST
ncbi:MAG: hypothetical protein KC766_26725, partial [Myxococcales bacterium]|nr:hypothetical protein [Myxococcales bacterium]